MTARIEWTAAEEAELIKLRAAHVPVRKCSSLLEEKFRRRFEETNISRTLLRLEKARGGGSNFSSSLEREPYAQIQDVKNPTPTTTAEVGGLGFEFQGPTGPIVSVEKGTVADRTYVDKEESGGAYVFRPLDLGSRQVERILLLPDIHTPFHDRYAWALVGKFAREFQPDTIVQLGDWIDCYTVSDHDKDPRRVHQLEDEAKGVRGQREELESLGAQRLIRTRGNHEHRFTTHVMQRAPALLSSVNLDTICGWDNGRWSNVPYLDHGMLGKLAITHCADKQVAGAGAVRSAANMFAASVAFGHTHRLSCEYFGDILGRRHISVSLGCLADISAADYASVANKRFWTLGFGVAFMTADGRFSLQPMPIVGRRIYYGERLVEL